MSNNPSMIAFQDNNGIPVPVSQSSPLPTMTIGDSGFPLIEINILVDSPIQLLNPDNNRQKIVLQVIDKNNSLRVKFANPSATSTTGMLMEPSDYFETFANSKFCPKGPLTVAPAIEGTTVNLYMAVG